MNTNVMTALLIYYNSKVSRVIPEKYGIDYMPSLKRFVQSETYKMLVDQDLEMWDFSPVALFDM